MHSMPRSAADKHTSKTETKISRPRLRPTVRLKSRLSISRSSSCRCKHNIAYCRCGIVTAASPHNQQRSVIIDFKWPLIVLRSAVSLRCRRLLYSSSFKHSKRLVDHVCIRCSAMLPVDKYEFHRRRVHCLLIR